MTADAEQVAERANDALDLTPTFDEVLGCVDCSKLFRTGAQCPFCASQSLLNIAGILNEHKVMERMRNPHIIEGEGEHDGDNG